VGVPGQFVTGIVTLRLKSSPNPMLSMKKILASLVVVGCLAALILTPRTSAANSPAASPTEPAIPDVVVNGFKEFKTGGYSAAITTWSHDSSLLLDSAAQLALNNFFSQISNNAGPFVGADMVRVVNLSPNTEIVYAVTKYERHLVFISFTCYKANNKWLVTWIDADKDPAKVLPTNILSGQ